MKRLEILENRKKLKNAGKSYINYKGKNVEKRKIGPPCKCRRQCFDSLGNLTCKMLFSELYSLPTYEDQTRYLCERIQFQDETEKIKNKRRLIRYEVPVGGTTQVICRKAFMSIFAIQIRRLNVLLDKKTNMVLNDLRGTTGIKVKSLNNKIRSFLKALLINPPDDILKGNEVSINRMFCLLKSENDDPRLQKELFSKVFYKKYGTMEIGPIREIIKRDIESERDVVQQYFPKDEQGISEQNVETETQEEKEEIINSERVGNSVNATVAIIKDNLWHVLRNPHSTILVKLSNESRISVTKLFQLLIAAKPELAISKSTFRKAFNLLFGTREVAAIQNIINGTNDASSIPKPDVVETTEESKEEVTTKIKSFLMQFLQKSPDFISSNSDNDVNKMELYRLVKKEVDVPTLSDTRFSKLLKKWFNTSNVATICDTISHQSNTEGSVTESLRNDNNIKEEVNNVKEDYEEASNPFDYHESNLKQKSLDSPLKECTKNGKNTSTEPFSHKRPKNKRKYLEIAEEDYDSCNFPNNANDVTKVCDSSGDAALSVKKKKKQKEHDQLNTVDSLIFEQTSNEIRSKPSSDVDRNYENDLKEKQVDLVISESTFDRKKEKKSKKCDGNSQQVDRSQIEKITYEEEVVDVTRSFHKKKRNKEKKQKEGNVDYGYSQKGETNPYQISKIEDQEEPVDLILSESTFTKKKKKHKKRDVRNQQINQIEDEDEQGNLIM